MMIDPNGYYEHELKGKSTAQILAEIKRLRKEINKIKLSIENPTTYLEHRGVKTYREYLDKARQALVESGGEYIPSKIEEKDTSFNNEVDCIKNIYFEKTVYDIPICRNIIFDKEKVYTQSYFGFSTFNETEIVELKSFDTEYFLQKIKDLHLGEWRRNYQLDKKYIVFDGTARALRIYFSTGRVENFSGHAMYPYNFDELESLLMFEEDALF